MDLQWASRFPSLWPLAGLEATRRQSPAESATLAHVYAQLLMEMVTKDFSALQANDRVGGPARRSVRLAAELRLSGVFPFARTVLGALEELPPNRHQHGLRRLHSHESADKVGAVTAQTGVEWMLAVNRLPLAMQPRMSRLPAEAWHVLTSVLSTRLLLGAKTPW